MSEEKPVSSEQRVCKSCGNHFMGLYCNMCGEKVLEAEDRTFKHFLSNIVTFSFIDNKFLKTLKLILLSPGFLSKEYAEGRRVNYLRPLQLFFIFNLIYFLFPLLQLFNTSLHTQMYLRVHSPLVRKLVNHKLEETGFSFQGYSLMYNDKSTSLAKLVIILFVVIVSVPFALIFRKQKRYFSEHLTLSVELAAFNLAVNAVFLSLILIISTKIIHWTHMGWEKYLDDVTLTVIFIMTNLFFLFKAGRTFYQERGFMLIIKVVISLLGMFLALEMYRLILFLVTFWSLS
jgi:hypothetical protein